MLGYLIILVIVALIAGFLARAIVPGRDPMSIWGTLLLGIVGSFVGGFLGWLLFGKDRSDGALQLSGLFGSVVGAVIVLLIVNYLGRRKRGGVIVSGRR